MPTETPLTAAWTQLRDEITTATAEYRAAGRTVVEAYADHGTVRPESEEVLSVVFTVPGDVATTLRETLTPAAIDHTEIQYVDVGGHRLYLLKIHHENESPIAFVAGGIRRETLEEHAGTTGRAETIIRTLDETVAVKLRHETRTPFLTDLDQ